MQFNLTVITNPVWRYDDGVISFIPCLIMEQNDAQSPPDLIFFSCGNKLSLANLDTKCMQRKENQDTMIHFRYTLHRKCTK